MNIHFFGGIHIFPRGYNPPLVSLGPFALKISICSEHAVKGVVMVVRGGVSRYR